MMIYLSSLYVYIYFFSMNYVITTYLISFVNSSFPFLSGPVRFFGIEYFLTYLRKICIILYAVYCSKFILFSFISMTFTNTLFNIPYFLFLTTFPIITNRRIQLFASASKFFYVKNVSALFFLPNVWTLSKMHKFHNLGHHYFLQTLFQHLAGPALNPMQ